MTDDFSPIASPQNSHASPIEIPSPSQVQVAPNWKEWMLPTLLFVATLFTTTVAGLMYAGYSLGFLSAVYIALVQPSILLRGLPFSFTFMAILLAHEMGHFLACRHYGIRCTPPFFIPLPISIAGTLGAFIRIKSQFQHKRALFDVAVAGPLAGFVLVVPALIIGIAFSTLVPKGSMQGGFSFGEPLLFKWFGWLVLGYQPAQQDMVAHPIAVAAWFGLLATFLNLLPVWQLDGGHIAYAVLGRMTQKRLSVAAAVSLVLVSFMGWPIPSYLVFGVLLLILGARFRFYHPPTLSDEENIGPGRVWVSLLALAILIVSFTPVPFSVS